jgi:hypothetical protein
MAWLKSYQTLKDNPKLRSFMRRLKISRCEAIGRLHFLWYWAMDFAPDGDITKFKPEHIADAMEWEGDAKELYDALVQCGYSENVGFIELRDGGAYLHDWDEYFGSYETKRADNAERQRRWYENNKSQPNANLTRPNADLTEPNGNLTQPNANLTHREEKIREEERREDKRREENPKDSSPEPGGASEGERQYLPEQETPTEAEPCKIEAPPGTVKPDDFKTLWNEILVPIGFQRLVSMSPNRQRAFHARCGEGKERLSVDWWREYLLLVARGQFLVDSARAKATWVTPDWFLNPNNLTKVLEGKYSQQQGLSGREMTEYDKARETTPSEILRGFYQTRLPDSRASPEGDYGSLRDEPDFIDTERRDE